MHLNYINGIAHIASAPLSGADIATVEDILLYNDEQLDGTLTAKLDEWLVMEMLAMSHGYMRDQLEHTVFNDDDFLGDVLDELGINVDDYPDLREIQHNTINFIYGSK